MPKRSSKDTQKKEMQDVNDINRIAKSAKNLAVGNPIETDPLREKNPAAVALGRLGGLKGGRARADKLSPRKRKQIAKKAAQARWSARA